MTEARGALPPKLYFRIGEVAGLVGVEPHVLRYWEREFRSIRPSKSAKGQRVYSRRDVENLMRVRELLYGHGFTIAGAKKQLREKGVEPEALHTEAVHTEAIHTETGALPARAPAAAQTSGHADASMRAELETLKAEVEAFLRELSPET
jgi:DNA-binding transcriptional MerR regulator